MLNAPATVHRRCTIEVTGDFGDEENVSKYLKRNGAPEEIRTPNPQIRSLMLYPVELRARIRRPATRRRETGRDTS